jgi:hypothetical protein
MSKATIHAPVEDFTGKVGSVAFADGVGTLELPSTELSYFIRHGYKVEVGKSSKADKSDKPDAKPTTVDGLKAYAAEKGIDLGEAKTKAEIAAAIDAAEQV